MEQKFNEIEKVNHIYYNEHLNNILEIRLGKNQVYTFYYINYFYLMFIFIVSNFYYF